MTKFILLPGEIACNMVGFPHDSENRIVLRMFTNTVFWGVVGVVTVVAVMV